MRELPVGLGADLPAPKANMSVAAAGVVPPSPEADASAGARRAGSRLSVAFGADLSPFNGTCSVGVGVWDVDAAAASNDPLTLEAKTSSGIGGAAEAGMLLVGVVVGAVARDRLWWRWASASGRFR